MQTLLIALSLVAHAGKWTGAESDVIVEKVVPASPEAVLAPLTDLAVLKQVFPADCVVEWVDGTQTTGIGAVSRVTYKIGPLRRRLTMSISKSEPGRMIEYDHAGKKGFVTQFRAEKAEGGTKLTLGTWISAPPWPLKGTYFNKVKPAWEACWTRALDSAAAQAASSAPAAPAAAPAAPAAEANPL